MADDDGTYCAPGPAPERDAVTGGGPGATDEGPFAACVLCQEPTEYPESHKGVTLCPVCAWQEAQRTACSG
ncbi:hypothetical protein ABZ626_12015 [Streptomyces longispororuber]|uniref:hypothetical protein n=1 Tax=Streptomyces longispororuber TaxID=68230 RepID=UPI0033EBABAE